MIERLDGTKNGQPMTDRLDSNFLEEIVIQLRKRGPPDVVLLKRLVNRAEFTGGSNS